MISHASFQEQVIDTLQAYIDLTNIVALGEIREESWQGTEFSYPNVRVDVRTQTPEGSGNCREKASIEYFSVLAFSDLDSSLECERICFEIIECLFGAALYDEAASQGPNWMSRTVNLVQFNAPRRGSEKVWRGEVAFKVRVQEVA